MLFGRKKVEEPKVQEPPKKIKTWKLVVKKSNLDNYQFNSGNKIQAQKDLNKILTAIRTNKKVVVICRKPPPLQLYNDSYVIKQVILISQISDVRLEEHIEIDSV